MSGVKLLFERYVRTQDELLVALESFKTKSGIINCAELFDINTNLVVPEGCTIDFGWREYVVNGTISLNKRSAIRNGYLKGLPVVSILESEDQKQAVISNITMVANSLLDKAIVINTTTLCAGIIIQHVSIRNYTTGLYIDATAPVKHMSVSNLIVNEVVNGITANSQLTESKLYLAFTPRQDGTSKYALNIEGTNNTIDVFSEDTGFSPTSTYLIRTPETNKLVTNVPFDKVVNLTNGSFPVNQTLSGTVNLTFDPLTGILYY